MLPLKPSGQETELTSQSINKENKIQGIVDTPNTLKLRLGNKKSALLAEMILTTSSHYGKL
jgi:hypothetical protein